METTTNPIDVVISFDTTGSMYPVLTQVRRKVKEAVERLMSELPGIQIGIIAHGDYYDPTAADPAATVEPVAVVSET